MRIAVDTIPDQGLSLSVDLSAGDASWALQAATEALGAPPEALAADLKVERLGDHVRISGRGSSAVVLPCDRCGEPVNLRLGGPIDLYYRPTTKEDDADLELSADDLDIGWYDGEAIVLDDVLAEQLALWVPSRVRCGDRNVTQVGPPHPCALPPMTGPDLKPPSPFAKLRLPE